MLENQLSRYGSFSRGVPGGVLAPSAKVFLVGDSDDTTYGVANLGAEYPPDKDGVTRVYTTVQAAVNAAAANRGDVVLVAPNHVEILNRADSWNTAGIQIIGMGQGEQRSGVNMDTTGSTIEVSASGVRISNLMFTTRNTAVTRCIDLDTGFFGNRIDNCIFTFDATGDDFVTVIRMGSKESIVEDNVFRLEDTTGYNFAVSLLGGDPDGAIIRRNTIMGNYDCSVIGQDTTDTLDTNLTGVVIQDNIIVNGDTAGAMHLRTSAGYTIRGIASGNRIADYDTSSADTTHFAAVGIRMVNNLLRSDSTEKTLGL